MNEMKKILEGVYSNLELRQTVVPLFISQPGYGKTRVIEEFARNKGAKLVEIIASQILPYEISGMAVPSHQKERMTYYDFDKINDLNDGDVIFFDELLAGAPQVLSACLTLIEQRRTISGKPLPKVMIVAASNPQNQLPIPPAIKERFIYYNISFDKNSWKEYMAKYLITNEIFEQLCTVIQSESFNSNGSNFFTPRSIEKAINMLLNDIPTPYSQKLLPILNTKVQNTSDTDLTLKSGKVFKKEEFIPWLELMKNN
jgi:hypothetical protein